MLNMIIGIAPLLLKVREAIHYPHSTFPQILDSPLSGGERGQKVLRMMEAMR